MNEIEKLQRARMYLQKLANGIDPITDNSTESDSVLNNVRLSRCFFYVVEVLDSVIANDGEVGKKKTKTAPFFITDEQKAKILPIANSVNVSLIADRINDLTAENNCRKFQAKWITEWLLAEAYLDIEVDVKGQNRKVVNEKGNGIGISITNRESKYGTYTVNIYDPNAQKFVVNNLDKILEHAQGKRQETGWSAAHDKTLVDLYSKKVPYYEMAITFKRSMDEVKARLKELGVEIEE